MLGQALFLGKIRKPATAKIQFHKYLSKFELTDYSMLFLYYLKKENYCEYEI